MSRMLQFVFVGMTLLLARTGLATWDCRSEGLRSLMWQRTLAEVVPELESREHRQPVAYVMRYSAEDYAIDSLRSPEQDALFLVGRSIYHQRATGMMLKVFLRHVRSRSYSPQTSFREALVACLCDAEVQDLLQFPLQQQWNEFRREQRDGLALTPQPIVDSVPDFSQLGTAAASAALDGLPWQWLARTGP